MCTYEYIYTFVCVNVGTHIHVVCAPWHSYGGQRAAGVSVFPLAETDLLLAFS